MKFYNAYICTLNTNDISFISFIDFKYSTMCYGYRLYYYSNYKDQYSLLGIITLSHFKKSICKSTILRKTHSSLEQKKP